MVSVSTSPWWVGSTCLRGTLGTWCGKGCAAGCAWCPKGGALGGQSTQAVRKRTEKPSIIWLHDGLWIGKDVDDQILSASEKHVRQLLFLPARCLIVSSRSTACKRHGRRLFLPAPLLPILPCYPNAHTVLGEVGADGSLPGIFLLPNLATDKPLSGNSLATLTELASVPALAGANTALSPWSTLKMILLFFGFDCDLQDISL